MTPTKQKNNILLPGKDFIENRRKNKVRRAVIDISFGLLNKVCDLTLLFLIFNEEMIKSGGRYGRGARNFERRFTNYYPGVNIKQLVESMRTLRKKRWIVRGGAITKEGSQRLQNLFPKIYPKKQWDGNWYIVNFDIPEKLRHKRNILRDHLRRLGFGMFQQSIWISPINFLEIIQKETKKLGLAPYAICSKTQNLGEENSRIMANRIWHLDSLNKQYEEFILRHERGISLEKFPLVFMEFMRILKNDPQLPTEFLPSKWFGTEAYNLVRDFYSTGGFNAEYAKIFFGK